MASDPFNLWDEVVLTPPTSPAPTAGVQYTLGSTPEEINGPTARDSIEVVIEYSAITPDITAGSPPFRVGAILESKNDAGKWVTVAYQFSPIRNSESAGQRRIILQPDISDFNTGIDDVVYPVNREVARISRQQGFLPDQPWRICIVCVDQDPQGANGLQSVTVSISGTRYDRGS